MSNNFIVVDAMGGDNAPLEVIKGAVAAVNENDKINVILVGKEDVINSNLKNFTYNENQIKVQNASQIIENCEAPTTAMREKKDSSIIVGLNLLKSGQASGFVSAGSTGAILTAATMISKRIKGVNRPALATLLPTENNKYVFVMDVGANMDCKPNFLLQFAKMGQIYMENVLNVPNPKIGLVNVGAEEEKGDTLTRETFQLLKEDTSLNFVGNIEAREISKGNVDVVVCDGFVGNVILKLSEGIVKSFSNIIKTQIKSNLLYSLGGLLSKGAFKNIKKMFDYSEIGGAPFLGLNHIVVKAHGSSNYNAIKNAINQCHKFIENDLVSKIEQSTQN